MAEKQTGFDLASVLADVSDLDTFRVPDREQIEYIDIDLIDADPNNFYAISEIDALAANIELIGLQQPLRVRTSDADAARVTTVSGHRRRVAIRKLVDEGREDLRLVACIREQAAASGAMQELRLIYANSDTRVISSADQSKQVARVEALLYQLKEEGYEFPGRMRDHVAEVCKISKTKIARLKMIRENLVHQWTGLYEKNEIGESVAYTLSQLPEDYQIVIFDTLTAKSGGSRFWLHENTVKVYAEAFKKIDTLACKKQHLPLCTNIQLKRVKVISDNAYYSLKCDKCCSKCPELAKCKYACPQLADKVKQLKADAKEARRQEKIAQEEHDRPLIEQLQKLWYRFGVARAAAGKSIKEVYEAASMYYSKSYEAEFQGKEDLFFDFKPTTNLPYGYNFGLEEANKFIRMADLLDCSLDYLFCRTDNPGGNGQPDGDSATDCTPAMTPAWHPASEKPPLGAHIITVDNGGFAEDCYYEGADTVSQNAVTQWCDVAMWAHMPSFDSIGNGAYSLPSAQPASWHPGEEDPEESIDAVAVFNLDEKCTVRKIAHWNGRVWSFPGGATIDAKCVKWYPLPDDKEDDNGTAS